jgi:hypothetical protein
MRNRTLDLPDCSRVYNGYKRYDISGGRHQNDCMLHISNCEKVLSLSVVPGNSGGVGNFLPPDVGFSHAPAGLRDAGGYEMAS